MSEELSGGETCRVPGADKDEKADKPAAEHQKLTPHEVQLVSAARNEYLKLVGSEEAYQASIHSIEKWQAILDVLSFLLAVWTLFFLWLAGDRTSHLHDVLSIIGMGLSLAVGSMVVWSWRVRWSEQVEKKQELSRLAHDLIVRYKTILAEPKIDLKALKKWNADREEFHEKEKNPRARVPTWCNQVGFRHICMKHPETEIRCEGCKRLWAEIQPKVGGWKPFASKCKNCGVPK